MYNLFFFQQNKQIFIVIQAGKDIQRRKFSPTEPRVTYGKPKLTQNQITMFNKEKEIERNTDLDISWLEVDEHVVSNHKPNWNSNSKTPNTQYSTQKPHLQSTLTTPQITCVPKNRTTNENEAKDPPLFNCYVSHNTTNKTQKEKKSRITKISLSYTLSWEFVKSHCVGGEKNKNGKKNTPLCFRCQTRYVYLILIRKCNKGAFILVDTL